MFKWLICFAILAVVCHAEHCNLMQRLKVKYQWTEVYGFGLDRKAIGTALWRSIFAKRPEALGFFKRVNGQDIESPKFQAHISRIFSGLDIAIALLDDQPVFDAEIEHLYNQHKERGISADYFDTFRKSLMLIVEASIESCYDAEAWDECTEVISKGIGGGAH